MLSEAINPRQHGVHAVVVTFNPRMEALRCLLDALSPQVEIITVVDNGSVNEMQTWEPESYDNVQIHRIGTNLGIAAAHNIGIKKALDEEVDYVLLSDQDSIPTPNMVFELRKAAEQLTDVLISCVLKKQANRFQNDAQRPASWTYIKIGPAPRIRGIDLQQFLDMLADRLGRLAVTA